MQQEEHQNPIREVRVEAQNQNLMLEKERWSSSRVLEESLTMKFRKKLIKRIAKFLTNPNVKVNTINLLDQDCQETGLRVETGEGMVTDQDQDREVDTNGLEAGAEDLEVEVEGQEVRTGTEEDIIEDLDQGHAQQEDQQGLDLESEKGLRSAFREHSHHLLSQHQLARRKRRTAPALVTLQIVKKREMGLQGINLMNRNMFNAVFLQIPVEIQEQKGR